MSSLVLEIVRYADAQQTIQAIRHEVFQVEQGVSPELDFDGFDEPAIHIIAYYNEQPVGTMRLRYLNKQLVKLERVAVLSTHRGRGIGKALMEKAITFLDSCNISNVKLHAQAHASDFYKKLGFEPRGATFDEAGIAHIEMWRSRPQS